MRPLLSSASSTFSKSALKTGLPPTPTCRKAAMAAVRNQRGQGLIEYLIVVALIAVATIGIMRVVGQAVGTRFASISEAIQGRRLEPPVDKIDDNLLKRRDLGDFMNGVGSTGGGRGSSSSSGQ